MLRYEPWLGYRSSWFSFYQGLYCPTLKSFQTWANLSLSADRIVTLLPTIFSLRLSQTWFLFFAPMQHIRRLFSISCNSNWNLGGTLCFTSGWPNVTKVAHFLCTLSPTCICKHLTIQKLRLWDLVLTWGRFSRWVIEEIKYFHSSRWCWFITSIVSN